MARRSSPARPAYRRSEMRAGGAVRRCALWLLAGALAGPAVAQDATEPAARPMPTLVDPSRPMASDEPGATAGDGPATAPMPRRTTLMRFVPPTADADAPEETPSVESAEEAVLEEVPEPVAAPPSPVMACADLRLATEDGEQDARLTLCQGDIDGAGRRERALIAPGSGAFVEAAGVLYYDADGDGRADAALGPGNRVVAQVPVLLAGTPVTATLVVGALAEAVLEAAGSDELEEFEADSQDVEDEIDVNDDDQDDLELAAEIDLDDDGDPDYYALDPDLIVLVDDDKAEDVRRRRMPDGVRPSDWVAPEGAEAGPPPEPVALSDAPIVASADALRFLALFAARPAPPEPACAAVADLGAQLACEKAEWQAGRLSEGDYAERKTAALARLDPAQIGFENSLLWLNVLLERELITRGEYEARRTQILEQL